MSRTEKFLILLISCLILSAYILPYWFVIKESASARSRFSIKRLNFGAGAAYKDAENQQVCDADFSIVRDERILDIKLICKDMTSEFKFRDSKLISQNIKGGGKYFIRLLTSLAENEELMFPLPVSSEKLKSRICNIADDCSEVKYRRLGGSINYQFVSKDKSNYYMIDKETFLPAALFIKEKSLSIEAKKYYSFGTNIKFPSVIEIRNDREHLILSIEDLEIE
ncbi:MAG: hypothetical protein N3B13_00405 [Deltaproteobacteria bacterium]|nr:hypothetical protein [Deltaproteobacteria bacterium]